MTIIKDVMSLEMLKMEKNFIAVIDKGYSRQPYLSYSIPALFGFVEREMKELQEAFNQYRNKQDYDEKESITKMCYRNKQDYDEKESITKMCNEIADISNTLDYLYERLLMYRC